VAVAADITGIYPDVRDESYTFAVLSNAYEGLTRLGRDLRPEPAVAARWENPDDRTWVFRLRAGLRFSDGRSVTPADVVASLRHALAETATRHTLAAIRSVEAAPDGSVHIATRGPAPTLLLPLSSAFIVPAADLSRPRGAWPAGTGPYLVESWAPGRELVLEANAHWRGGAPSFERLRLRVTPEAAERARALRAGEVDLADALGLDELDRPLPAGFQIVSRPALRVLFLAFRVDGAPFADARVREAFDLAIDRDELIARALHGHGTPVGQVVPPDLLRVAGDGAREVVLHGPTQRTAIMQEVARQLAEVGVRARVDARAKEDFFSLLDATDTRFFLFSWSCDGADAGNALGSLLHTPNAAGLGFENSQGLSDAALDALVDAADVAPTYAQRQRLLAAGLARVAELRAVLPLLVQHEAIGLGPRLRWDPPLDMALRLEGARSSGRESRQPN
jgi:peptide/nickel transport system substrate-binding protein